VLWTDHFTKSRVWENGEVWSERHVTYIERYVTSGVEPDIKFNQNSSMDIKRAHLYTWQSARASSLSILY
jgi:hypothetical protein